MLENDYANLWLEDDVAYIAFKNETTLDLIAAKKIREDYLQLIHGKKYPLLVDVSGLQSISKEAKDVFAQLGASVKIAIISENLSGLTRAHFYTELSNPKSPTKVFQNVQAALKYLMS
jgi:hypothetical protein